MHQDNGVMNERGQLDELWIINLDERGERDANFWLSSAKDPPT
jgi:hypothetical protein